MSSVKTLEEAKVSKGCLYMAMPVQEVRGVCYCGGEFGTNSAWIIVWHDAVWKV